MKSLVGVIIFLSTTVHANDYIYKIKKNLSPMKAQNVQRILDKYKVRLSERKNTVKLNSKVAKELSKTKAFLYLEEDKIISAPVLNEFVGKESFLKSSKRTEQTKGWHLDKINAREAWNTTQGDPKVIVAFCDSGIDKRQAVFKNKVLVGRNFIGRNSNTSHYTRYRRPNTHGTSVAAFIAGDYTPAQDNGGIAPGVSLLPGLITNGSGSTSTSRIINCIEWATAKGAKVINVSITGSTTNAARSAAKEAFKNGSIVVWSSGNGNRELAANPLEEMIVVGGTDKDDKRYLSGSYGSSFGASLDVMAPGEGVYVPWGNHTRINGTSFSAPIVSGAIALIYSFDPSLTPSEVVSSLTSTARKLGPSEFFGAGLVDVGAAIEMLKNR